MFSTDFGLDTEVWTIKLYKKSTYSTHANGEGVYLFDVTFRDFCWDSVLTPAVFSSTTLSVDLNFPFDFPFTAMEDTSQGLACGGYTYELEYMSGGPLDGSSPDLSPFSISVTPSLAGTITDFTWIGTHPMRIKCTNGQADTSPTARGVGGFFNSVYSA